MYATAVRNLNARAERDAHEVAEMDKRLKLPTADRADNAPKPKGRMRRGYANRAERHQKQRRRQKLAARLAHTQRRITEGTCRSPWVARRSPASATTLRPQA